MKFTHAIASQIVLVAFAGIAAAQMPRMGGPMRHIMVNLHMGDTLEGHVDPLVPTPVMQNYGETYAEPANVLDGMMYNCQYGWMVEGFWTPPSGSFLWIEQISATPGLLAYSGGTMMNPGAFAPIFGTDGSSPRIMWDGAMLHNWYAVTTPGEYDATYRIYFGDAGGAATPGYQPGDVNLNWTAVPAPGAVGVFVIAGLLAAHRRRPS